MNTFYFISKLPKNLQDHIANYNVEHRHMMRRVLDELVEYLNSGCFYCGEHFRLEDTLKYDGHCSFECMDFEEYLRLEELLDRDYGHSRRYVH